MPYPAATGERPFGLRDVKITSLPGSTVVDVPVAQSLSFGLTSEQADMSGDDNLTNTRSFNPAVEGTLAFGGINPAVAAAVTGGVLSTSGTTPAQIQKLAITGATTPGRVKIQGRSYSDDVLTSGFGVTIYYAKFNNPSWTLEGGTYLISSCDYRAVPNATNDLIDIEYYETFAAVA
jgi:hypothetical protein